MKITIISDTHGSEGVLNLPGGDILIHCGDFTGGWKTTPIEQQFQMAMFFDSWLSVQPYKHKILIAGNHDFVCEQRTDYFRTHMNSCIYLQDEMVEIEGFKIYGTPWQPWFHDWAFNVRDDEKRAEIFSKIPEGIDILMTHCPPKNILDKTVHGFNVGCPELLKRVLHVKPKIHCFGHIHECAGQIKIDETIFINASIMDSMYEPVNLPIHIEI